MASMAQYSRALQGKLADAGLQGSLQADAFKTLLQYVAEVQGDLDVLYSIFDTLRQGLEAEGVVTKAQVESAIRQLAGSTTGVEHVTVIDAFKVPRVRYDAIHKRLVQDNSPLTLQPDGAAKIRLYQGRFSLLQQRLRRNKLFAPLNAVQASLPRELHAQLTELTGLKGRVGQRCIVLGLLGSQEDGSLTLEDEGAVLPVDLSRAKLAAGFVTENCVVVAEGVVGHDGVLAVSAIGFPGCERREDLPATAQKLNFFGAPLLRPEQSALLELAEVDRGPDRLLFLANVWLDRPDTFEALHTLFMGLQDAAMIPAMIVIMGNFSSAAAAAAAPGGGSSDFVALREGFGQLARLIDTYRAIRDGSRFVFVPGPGDPGLGALLPQPRLPSYFTAELSAVLPNAVFATNPCRIKYFTREIVVFRYDLMKALRRRCLTPLADGVTDAPESLFSQLALTLLQQSTLCPLPLAVQPVHWAHEQALGLYPLPHAVVVADSAPQASFSHEGCTVFNPGCLPERLFAAFLPFEGEVEPSALPGAAPGTQEEEEEEEEQVQQQEQQQQQEAEVAKPEAAFDAAGAAVEQDPGAGGDGSDGEEGAAVAVAAAGSAGGVVDDAEELIERAAAAAAAAADSSDDGEDSSSRGGGKDEDEDLLGEGDDGALL